MVRQLTFGTDAGTSPQPPQPTASPILNVMRLAGAVSEGAPSSYGITARSAHPQTPALGASTALVSAGVQYFVCV